MFSRLPQRRHFLIERFQYRLLFTNIAYFVVTVSAVAAVLFLPLIGRLLASGPQQHDTVDVFLFLHARFWPAVLGVFVLLLVHSVLTSHRIAGPIYRFRTILEAVGEGDLLARARLRKHDYLTKEAKPLNAMVESLQAKLQAIDEHQRGARAGLDRLKGALDTTPGEEIERSIECLEAEIELLRSSINQFRIDAHESQHPGRRDEKGFSVIELIVVVLVIGIIASIVAPLYFIALDRARQRRTMADMRSIGAANGTFRVDAGNYAAALADLSTQGYMQVVPLNDAWGTAWSYQQMNGGVSYELKSLGSDGAAGPVAPQPWINEPYECDIELENGAFKVAPTGQ